MTAGELQNLIVTLLVKAHGGTRQQWRRAIGDVRVYPVSTHPHCNWDIRSSGTVAEMAAIERLLDTVRLERPHVYGP